MMVNEVIAIVIGYLLGSIPSAYIATRLATGRDIRQMGGGNVGGLNTYREVGAIPALAVGIVDIGKGVAAVAIAYWLLDVPQLFVVLAGLAAVVGHTWMVFLKFRGGGGGGEGYGFCHRCPGYPDASLWILARLSNLPWHNSYPHNNHP